MVYMYTVSFHIGSAWAKLASMQPLVLLGGQLARIDLREILQSGHLFSHAQHDYVVDEPIHRRIES